MVIEPIAPELLTIQQVADRVGLTRQALYPRLDRDLTEFYIEVDGRKMLKATVIDYILSKPVSKVDSKVDDRLLDALQAQVNLLSDRLAKSDEQLAIKDEQLNVKDIQLAEKDRQLANADARLQEAHVLAKNVQDKLPQLAAPSESEPPASEQPVMPQTVPEQPVKQKWYQRLFVRRESTK